MLDADTMFVKNISLFYTYYNTKHKNKNNWSFVCACSVLMSGTINKLRILIVKGCILRNDEINYGRDGKTQVFAGEIV